MIVSFLFMWTKMIIIRFIIQNEVVPTIENVPKILESEECLSNICSKNVK
jgi:hypothetical protein